VIGTREDVIYRQTPRENDAVNSCWMCDYGRLNFEYLQSHKRLLQPEILSGDKLIPADWNTAIAHAAAQLKHFSGWEIAIIASGRMTNEELWLTRQFANLLGVDLIDIVPRSGPADNILLSADRNPNTNGARLLGVTGNPGARLGEIAEGVAMGRIRGLIALGEDAAEIGLSPAQLSALPAFVVTNLLENHSTRAATALLPSFGFAEKRGSMINGKGRLQRLNRAVRGPGQARDDWEILRDLIQAYSGRNGIYSIEDVFRQMSESVPALGGLSLSKIGDLGVPVVEVGQSPAPPWEPAKEEMKKPESEHAAN
jgi:NADH-quinone oxidoreductase subunit G